MRATNSDIELELEKCDEVKVKEVVVEKELPRPVKDKQATINCFYVVKKEIIESEVSLTPDAQLIPPPSH